MANATAIHGTIIDHGKAPYKNNPENNLSYYVKLNQNGSDKTFWGNGIEDAIKEAELKNGDVATFVDRGTQAVNVPDKNNVGQFIQAKKRFWEAEKYEPSVELNNSIEVDNAPDIDVDAGQSSSTSQASEIDLSKGEAVKVDASKKRSLPQSIENNYIAIAKNRWLKDAKVNFYDKADPKSVAFEDRTTALATSKSDVKTVRSMLDLAQDKGWSSIKIKGDAEFKRQMWLEAQMRGIETKGYKPTEQDVAELQAIQEGQTKNEVTNDYQRSKEINAQKAQDQESAVSAPEATNDNNNKLDITATAAADAVIDDVNGKEEINEGMSQEQRSEQVKDASKAVAIDGSVEVATGGNYTAMAAVGSIAQDKAETKVLEAVKENDVFKNVQNVVDKSVAQHFDKQFEKYEALHQDLEDHRSAETKVNNHKYHNDPEPSNEVYAKSTPEVKEAVINNLAENMTNDTKQVLAENNIDQEQIERIAEFVNTDVRDRAAIDADSAKVASPMSDYVQATNAHIIRSLGTEKGVEIANQNSEKMLGDKINVEPLSAEKNGRYAEIVSDKLNEHNIDKLTIAKAQAIIHDPNSKDIQPQQTVDKYQQRIGEELYKSGYGKDSITIMNEISDKHHGIERDTPEFAEPAQRLGDVTAHKAQAEDKQQDNSLSTDDKGFKEVKVIEDTKIGDATRGAKIDTDKNSTKAVGIAAMRSMIEELYKNDAQKRESALKSIDEATPEILAGNRPDPQVDIKQQPAQVQIQTTKQPDMDRGR